ncbi:MAG: murein L,D-transpeptidase catalytic domain family protein [Gammaproteobacteria bacterium]|nr:murein L,D-transpeptidase catalytic domain family protein [Gammaproteobacteria bacterium]
MLLARAVVASALLSFLAAASAAETSVWSSLAQAAPRANPQMLRLAVEAMHCAVAHGTPDSSRLAVIDYSLPSTSKRLWVFDLQTRRLLFRERVAHGRNSGGNFARYFSDQSGSLASSLGLYRTLGTYSGHNGYSLRLEGLDDGFNDRALERAIVIHGAPYVSEEFARREGRIGRSWGCPAVRMGIARRLIDALKGGQFVFAYYPDPRWLSDSTSLRCDVAGRSRREVSLRGDVIARRAEPDEATAGRKHGFDQRHSSVPGLPRPATLASQ